jgi:hypothetical protein
MKENVSSMYLVILIKIFVEVDISSAEPQENLPFSINTKPY